MDPAVCAEMSQYALFDLASTSMNLRWRPGLQKSCLGAPPARASCCQILRRH